MKISVGIVGYGNLGRGVQLAIEQNPDLELKAIFTRRQPESLGASGPFVSLEHVREYQELIDVLILCGGSAKDLPEQGPMLAAYFNTVDSFDTHARIPEYFEQMDATAKKAGTLSLISIGWDPGLFSMMRLLTGSVLPQGQNYTFWGPGVSQGHSDAIRRLSGVRNAVQYTVPIQDAIDKIRTGENPLLTSGERHRRVCYVVPEENADLTQIETEIKNMPNYFADYETTVNFISAKELEAEHSGMAHGGFVIHAGTTGAANKQRVEFGLQLGSNPEFTGSVLVAYARAAYRLAKEGQIGARTIFDIPLAYLSPKSGAELRQELL